jgi:hypothetical protein
MRSRRGPRSFDAVALGRLETEAWASYYRREWPKALRAFVGMVREGFGLGPWQTLVGSWHVLRANQAWAPVPVNDPAAARESMRRFYAFVARHTDLSLDPVRASELEVRWWELHRAHQYDPSVAAHELVAAVAELYAYVYAVPEELVVDAATWRVRAMDLSDAWVGAGTDRAHPLLAEERRALVASYAALLDAVTRAPV